MEGVIPNTDYLYRARRIIRKMYILAFIYCVLSKILTIYVKLHFKWYKMYHQIMSRSRV